MDDDGDVTQQQQQQMKDLLQMKMSHRTMDEQDVDD